MKQTWFRKYLSTALLTALVVALLEAAASYPSSIKSFTTKIAGDTVQPSHINDLQDEVTAIETDLLSSWTQVVYGAGQYTATSGTWGVDSGDVTAFSYMKRGKTMIVRFNFTGTDVSSATSELFATIPAGGVAAGSVVAVVQCIDAGGAATAGIARVTTGDSVIRFQATVAGAGFSLTAGDNTTIRGEITLELQ